MNNIWKVDPFNITNYNLENYQLEHTILFWICAAGKNATTAINGLYKLLGNHKYAFGLIKNIGQHNLPIMLQTCGIGCYRNKARTMWELANSDINLRTCSAEQLENIYGIGMKTSRCFILHSRKGARYSGLDTHILKYLRDSGFNAPKNTPTKKKYLELEKEFLKIADKLNMSPADLDLKIWKEYRG